MLLDLCFQQIVKQSFPNEYEPTCSAALVDESWFLCVAKTQGIQLKLYRNPHNF